MFITVLLPGLCPPHLFIMHTPALDGLYRNLSVLDRLGCWLYVCVKLLFIAAVLWLGDWIRYVTLFMLLFISVYLHGEYHRQTFIVKLFN